MSAEAAPPDKTEAARRFLRVLPLCCALGMEVVEAGDGWVLTSLDYDPRFVGDPATGVLHGGVVTALLDTSGGASVLLHPAGSVSTATIDLRIDYLRPAEPGQRLFARAECYRMTRTIAFVRAHAWTRSPEDVVATMAGAFTVERPA